MRSADGNPPGLGIPVRLAADQAADLRVDEPDAHRQLPAFALAFEAAGQVKLYLVPVVLFQPAHALVAFNQAAGVKK